MGDDNHVVIGMDPHKRSVTIEVMAGDELILRVDADQRRSGLRVALDDRQQNEHRRQPDISGQPRIPHDVRPRVPAQTESSERLVHHCAMRLQPCHEAQSAAASLTGPANAAKAWPRRR